MYSNDFLLYFGNVLVDSIIFAVVFHSNRKMAQKQNGFSTQMNVNENQKIQWQIYENSSTEIKRLFVVAVVKCVDVFFF